MSALNLGVTIGKGVGETLEEAQANANLIAAAPDLLEAVEPFAAFIDHLEERFDAENEYALADVVTKGKVSVSVLTIGHLRAARAAIKKARGE